MTPKFDDDTEIDSTWLNTVGSKVGDEPNRFQVGDCASAVGLALEVVHNVGGNDVELCSYSRICDVKVMLPDAPMETRGDLRRLAISVGMVIDEDE